MAKYTLLRVVQKCLNSMDSDEVENIDDTAEAEQIAEFAEEVYYELLDLDEWPHMDRLANLDAVSDPSSSPTVLKIKGQFRSISYVAYDVSGAGEDEDRRELTYLDPKEFFNRAAQLKSTDSNVVSVELPSDSLVTHLARNDKDPEYYTSIDDSHILLDSYDASKDSSVQSSKSFVLGEIITQFQLDNDYTPDIPIHFFPWYLAEVRLACHLYLKQQDSPRDRKLILGFKNRLRRTKSHLEAKDVRSQRQHYGRSGGPAQGSTGMGRR